MVKESLSRMPPPTGTVFHSDKQLRGMLRRSGLRVTRQRLSLARILFCQGHRHITAGELFAEARSARILITLATIYNVLDRFSETGLLRRFSVGDTRIIFDTNLAPHQHMFFQDGTNLVDVNLPAFESEILSSTSPPPNYDISRVDVTIHLRKINKDTAEMSNQQTIVRDGGYRVSDLR
jgi:Fur family transcriptional regulator, iron response regulator